jgi:hypothetical protein
MKGKNSKKEETMRRIDLDSLQCRFEDLSFLPMKVWGEGVTLKNYCKRASLFRVILLAARKS